MAPRTQLVALMGSLVVGLVACGYADPGDGTGTLKVVGTLACSFDTMQTEVHLEVSGTAQAQSNANITLLDADSKETVHVPADADAGHYTAAWPGCHRRVMLQVWSEADGLMARLEGPGLHTVAHPRAGSVMSVHDALDVVWATRDGVRAQEVLLEVTGENEQVARHILNHDRGHDHFKADVLAPGRSTLRVRRSHTLELLGGQEGSQVVASYSVSTPLVRQ